MKIAATAARRKARTKYPEDCNGIPIFCLFCI
jgi:hypothetical protein